MKVRLPCIIDDDNSVHWNAQTGWDLANVYMTFPLSALPAVVDTAVLRVYFREYVTRDARIVLSIRPISDLWEEYMSVDYPPTAYGGSPVRYSFDPVPSIPDFIDYDIKQLIDDAIGRSATNLCIALELVPLAWTSVSPNNENTAYCMIRTMYDTTKQTHILINYTRPQIYVDGRYGFDDNSGLEPAYPLRTLRRATDIAPEYAIINLKENCLHESPDGLILLDDAVLKNWTTTTSLIKCCYPTELYIANYNENTLSVYDLVRREIVATIAVGTNPLAVGVTYDNTKILVGNHGSNNISVIDTSNYSVVATVAMPSAPTDILIWYTGYLAHPGYWAWISCEGGQIVKFDIQNNSIERSYSTIYTGAKALVDAETRTMMWMVCDGCIAGINITYPAFTTDYIIIFEGHGNPINIVRHSIQHYVYVSLGGATNEIAVLNDDNFYTIYISMPAVPKGMCLNEDCSILFVACGIYLVLVDTHSNTILQTITLKETGTTTDAVGISYDPARARVYVTFDVSTGYQTVTEVNLKTNEVIEIEGFTSPSSFGKFINC